MKTTFMKTMSLFFIAFILFGCVTPKKKLNGDYDEIPPVLYGLTNKVQIALETGIFDKGESAVLDYIKTKHRLTYDWFETRGYEIKVGVVADYAVTMICDEGKPLFEDTVCRFNTNSDIDKDHRKDASSSGCRITITAEEIDEYCR